MPFLAMICVNDAENDPFDGNLVTLSLVLINSYFPAIRPTHKAFIKGEWWANKPLARYAILFPRGG